MAKLNVFTKENLALYDSLIKQYINTGDAKAIKKVTLNGRTLSFFKSEEEGAVADYTLTIPEQDLTALQNRIKANEDAIAAINNENTGLLHQAKVYADAEVKKLADGTVKDNADAIDALEGRADDLEDAVEKLDGDDTVEGSVKAQIKAVKEALEKEITDSEYDDTQVKADVKANADAIAAINNETTGILAQAKAHADGKDEAIQAAQKAGDDAQADVDALELAVGTVAEGKTVVGMIADAETNAKVTLATAETATEGYLKTYVISQGTTEVGKIDIPKELVVTGGEVVVDPEGQPAGTYVKLTIANQDEPIFINVKDLVDVYTAKADAAQVQLAISETNEISATIVAGSVGTTELADASVTAAKLADSAKALFDEAGSAADAETNAKKHATDLNTAMDTRVKELETAVGEGGSVDTQIDNAIAELDADVTSAAVEAGKGLQVQVVEEDGKVKTVAVTGNFDNAYDAKGAAEAAKKHATDLDTAMNTRVTTVEDLVGDGYQAITESEINALFA